MSRVLGLHGFTALDPSGAPYEVPHVVPSLDQALKFGGHHKKSVPKEAKYIRGCTVGTNFAVQA